MVRQRFALTAAIITFVVICIATCGLVSADPYTWMGTTNSLNDVSSNWSPAAVPGAGDDVTVDGSRPNQPQLNSDATYLSLSLTNGGRYTPGGGPARSLTVTGSITASGVGAASINGGGGSISCAALVLSGTSVYLNTSGAGVTIGSVSGTGLNALTVDAGNTAVVIGSIASGVGALICPGSGGVSFTTPGGTSVVSSVWSSALVFSASHSLTASGGAITIGGSVDYGGGSGISVLLSGAGGVTTGAIISSGGGSNNLVRFVGSPISIGSITPGILSNFTYIVGSASSLTLRSGDLVVGDLMLIGYV